MKTFSIVGAEHYCQSFTPRMGIAERSLEDFRQSRLRTGSTIVEGTQLFDEYRACALRDVERCILLSASHYRRGLDLMIPSSSHWAQVTLYYGAWFAARALLGMFGCGVLNKHVVHVGRSSPGTQELHVQRIGARQNEYYVAKKGSHKEFWEIFYGTMPSIKRFVSNQFTPALSPVSSNDSWLIDERNRVNYNTVVSIDSSEALRKTFSEDSFPICLPGVLNTQYQICEGILGASSSIATQFGLATDALDALGPFATFQERILSVVYSPVVPDLVANTKKQELFDQLA